MSSLWDRLFGGRKPATPAQSAKDRLKFVLVADRTMLAPEDLNKMQSEILDVIRKYCRIREEDVELKFEQRDRESFLVADIPLSSPRPGEPGGSIRIETNMIIPEEPIDESIPEPAKPAEVKPAQATAPTPPASDSKPKPPAPKVEQPTPPLPKILEVEIEDEEATQPLSAIEKVKITGAPTGMKSDPPKDPSGEPKKDADH
jgi:cell division topological specificity factor MinE